MFDLVFELKFDVTLAATSDLNLYKICVDFDLFLFYTFSIPYFSFNNLIKSNEPFPWSCIYASNVVTAFGLKSAKIQHQSIQE